MVNGAEPKPPNPAVKPEEILNESTDLIANYIVGNLVISVTAGLISFAGFQIIGVRFALILAAWVAFTDLIPVVGAFIGAAGVAAVAAFQGPGVVIATLALLIGYQLLENFVIAPRVMNRAIDLSPVAVIVAIMVGGSLAGIFGALLALPVAAMVKIILYELLIPERIDAIRKDAANGGIQRRDGPDGRSLDNPIGHAATHLRAWFMFLVEKWDRPDLPHC